MGVDAGLYARELMKESANAILEVESEGELNPRTALKKAHSLTKSKGSSTACIIALCNDVSFNRTSFFATKLHFCFHVLIYLNFPFFFSESFISFF